MAWRPKSRASRRQRGVSTPPRRTAPARHGPSGRGARPRSRGGGRGAARPGGRAGSSPRAGRSGRPPREQPRSSVPQGARAFAQARAEGGRVGAQAPGPERVGTPRRAGGAQEDHEVGQGECGECRGLELDSASCAGLTSTADALRPPRQQENVLSPPRPPNRQRARRGAQAPPRRWPRPPSSSRCGCRAPRAAQVPLESMSARRVAAGGPPPGAPARHFVECHNDPDGIDHTCLPSSGEARKRRCYRGGSRLRPCSEAG